MTLPPPPGTRPPLLAAGLALAVACGCSGRAPEPGRPGRPSADYRSLRFGGEWVAVPYRGGLPTAPVAEPDAGYVPRPGDRVALADLAAKEVFLARDLDALNFYHSTPGPAQLGELRALADGGRLFVVAKGTAATVTGVVEGRLPLGLRAVELRLPGEKGGTAWVGDPFVRRAGDRPRPAPDGPAGGPTPAGGVEHP